MQQRVSVYLGDRRNAAAILINLGFSIMVRCVIFLLFYLLMLVTSARQLSAENWPRWRGPGGNAVSRETDLPLKWTTSSNVVWKAAMEGEGSSSPIIWNDRVFLTSASEEGERRTLHCLNRNNGKTLWTREIKDNYPEITSALTGHAAPTPVTNGRLVIAFFGNAGVVCYDFAGNQLWRRRFGEFDSELGLASSPVLFGDSVLLVCDHDGNQFGSFDSFLIALDVRTGKTRWKTDRRGLYRSWSTPILFPVANGRYELVVNAQDELRGYDPTSGKQLWNVKGMTGWVTPSPVSGHGMIFATSGKNGPTMAVQAGGRGDVTEKNILWQEKRGSPYICSPLLLGDQLYVHNEQGILTCRDAKTGAILYRQRLEGKFKASAVGGDGKIYITNDEGTTYVLQAGKKFKLLAVNSLDEECLASPGVSDGCLFLRTQHHLYCIRAAGNSKKSSP